MQQERGLPPREGKLTPKPQYFSRLVVVVAFPNAFSRHATFRQQKKMDSSAKKIDSSAFLFTRVVKAKIDLIVRKRNVQEIR